MKQLVKTEIIINIAPYESRVALIENGILQEIYLERESNRGISGNIYKGKIISVLPGMQAAFVDIGLEKAGFLHVSDVTPICTSDDDSYDFNNNQEDIRQWLREGQEILVQILKNPIGKKGARLSAHLSLAARYIVYIPDLDHIGISLKLDSEPERERLQSVIKEATNSSSPRGYIVRTVAEGVQAEEIKKDIMFLQNLWQNVLDLSSAVIKPGIVYEDLNLPMRVLRDFTTKNVERIVIDNPDSYSDLCDFADKFTPGIRDILHFYQNEMPIYDRYNIESQILKAIDRRVNLKSGGYLIIEQTEAMVTIDVNSGSFTKGINLEDTVYKTNLEAAQSIGRELRLRNLGGIIVIDFIDMEIEEHKTAVVEALSSSVGRDNARTTISNISPLGLVEMTRKRTMSSLNQFLSEPCYLCKGTGTIKTAQTICYDIFREIQSEANSYKNSSFLILASEKVISMLKNEESIGLAEIELLVKKPIKLKIDQFYSQEGYDIIFN